jgi:hypothetical protein
MSCTGSWWVFQSATPTTTSKTAPVAAMAAMLNGLTFRMRVSNPHLYRDRR